MVKQSPSFLTVAAKDKAKMRNLRSLPDLDRNRCPFHPAILQKIFLIISDMLAVIFHITRNGHSGAR
jgi:hypothetical protein